MWSSSCVCGCVCSLCQNSPIGKVFQWYRNCSATCLICSTSCSTSGGAPTNLTVNCTGSRSGPVNDSGRRWVPEALPANGSIDIFYPQIVWVYSLLLLSVCIGFWLCWFRLVYVMFQHVTYITDNYWMLHFGYEA